MNKFVGGVQLFNIKVQVLLFADDIVMVTERKEVSQKCLFGQLPRHLEENHRRGGEIPSKLTCRAISGSFKLAKTSRQRWQGSFEGEECFGRAVRSTTANVGQPSSRSGLQENFRTEADVKQHKCTKEQRK